MSEPSTLLFRRVPATVARRPLKEFVKTLESEVTGGRSFSCVLTHDDELRRLNRTFLQKDYATDVLSFPEPMPDGFLGEIAISFERAEAQAAEFKHPVEDEIRILILHGVLHLLGMDHEKDRGRMAKAESRWRQRLGLPAGLIERVRK